MNCLFPSLDSCDGGLTNCLDKSEKILNDAEKKKFRNMHLWRQDGMREKFCGTNDDRDHQSRTDRNEVVVDDDTITSYYSSRYHDSFMVKDPRKGEVKKSKYLSRFRKNIDNNSDTDITCPESNSIDSESSQWTKVTSGGQKNYERIDEVPLDNMAKEYERTEEASLHNTLSSDSVNAVYTSSKVPQPAQQQESVYSSAFDYILKASQKISNQTKDPPSDKSMATSRSIRAADAGSVLLRQGIIRRKNNELVRTILKRRQLGLQQAGTEP